jgi:hypothetical protein
MDEYQDVIEYLNDLEELNYTAIWDYDYPNDITIYEPVTEFRVIPALVTLGILMTELFCLPITLVIMMFAADRLENFNDRLQEWAYPTVYRPIVNI